MKFDSGTRTRLLADMTLDVDPSGTTPEVSVDGTWYAATWLGSATQSTVTEKGVTRNIWKQTCQTTSYFAGPDVTSPGGAVVLALGSHSWEIRVTSGSDILESPKRPTLIEVVD